MFLADVIPGLMQAGLFVIWIIIYTKVKNYPKGERIPWDEFWRVNVRASPALLLSVIILGGIYSGIVTVSEAAGIAALTAIIISVTIYRGCRLGEVLGIIAESIKLTAAIVFIILGALAFGHWITSSGIAEKLINFVTSNNLSSWQFLLMINVLMLALGMFLEVFAVILIVVPLVLITFVPQISLFLPELVYGK